MLQCLVRDVRGVGAGAEEGDAPRGPAPEEREGGEELDGRHDELVRQDDDDGLDDAEVPRGARKGGAEPHLKGGGRGRGATRRRMWGRAGVEVTAAADEGGRKQVTKRSTHARPGGHVQRCSPVLLLLSEAGGVHWPRARRCPSSPGLAYPYLPTDISFPLADCANGASGLSLCRVLSLLCVGSTQRRATALAIGQVHQGRGGRGTGRCPAIESMSNCSTNAAALGRGCRVQQMTQLALDLETCIASRRGASTGGHAAALLFFVCWFETQWERQWLSQAA